MKSKIFTWSIVALLLTRSVFSIGQTYDLKIALDFERSIFSSKAENEKRHFLKAKYEYFKNAGAFEEALTTLNRLEYGQKDSVRLCDFYFQKSLIQSIMKNYSGAMINVNEYCAICPELNAEKKKLRLIVLVENQNWTKFNQLVAEDSGIHSKIELKTPEYLESDSYLRSASYLPGLGLIRLGYTRKGISSLGLCVGALGFTAYNLATGFYATSILSGFDPFLKFYKGGKRLTEAMVDEKNEKKASSLKQTGLQFIQKNYF